MPKITKEEYARRALKFIEAHKENYTQREYEYIRGNIAWGMDKLFVSDLLRQVYDEIGMTDPKTNMYEGFVKLLEENFDLERDIIEIGGGIVPSLAKKIALRQKEGTITVYDPRLITDINHPDNLILKKEKFNKDTPIGNAQMIIGFMPCEATNLLIETACANNVDFMIALCEGGTREGYGWLEEDDEWIGFVKYCASRGIEDANLGTLEERSLEQYDNPYPVIYNKRRKS